MIESFQTMYPIVMAGLVSLCVIVLGLVTVLWLVCRGCTIQGTNPWTPWAQKVQVLRRARIVSTLDALYAIKNERGGYLEAKSIGAAWGDPPRYVDTLEGNTFNRQDAFKMRKLVAEKMKGFGGHIYVVEVGYKVIRRVYS